MSQGQRDQEESTLELSVGTPRSLHIIKSISSDLLNQSLYLFNELALPTPLWSGSECESE